MNIALKAALFSAFLFPGWGHFYLKKYKRGFFFLLPVLACVTAILGNVFTVGINILKTIPINKNEADIAAILQLSLDAVKMVDTFYFYLLIFLIIIFWALSIIDSYILGKKMMQEYVPPESHN